VVYPKGHIERQRIRRRRAVRETSEEREFEQRLFTDVGVSEFPHLQENPFRCVFFVAIFAQGASEKDGVCVVHMKKLRKLLFSRRTREHSALGANCSRRLLGTRRAQRSEPKTPGRCTHEKD